MAAYDGYGAAPGVPQGLPPHLKNSSPSLLSLQQTHHHNNSTEQQQQQLQPSQQAPTTSSSSSLQDLTTARKKKQKDTPEKTALTSNAPLPFTSFIRTIVSKNKIRYCDAGFNLDLSC